MVGREGGKKGGKGENRRKERKLYGIGREGRNECAFGI